MKLLKGLRTRPTKFGSLPKRSSATDITSSPILFRDRTDSIDSQLKAHVRHPSPVVAFYFLLSLHLKEAESLSLSYLLLMWFLYLMLAVSYQSIMSSLKLTGILVITNDSTRLIPILQSC